MLPNHHSLIFLLQFKLKQFVTWDNDYIWIIFYYFISINSSNILDTKGHQRQSSFGKIKGSLKLGVCYRKGSLQVMVMHARDLATPFGQDPSAYVKIYLRPNYNKQNKRKTRVIKKNRHPTYMEMVSTIQGHNAH